MIASVIIIEGEAIEEESLKISLMNAKQLVLGKAPQFGFILHVAANSIEDFSNALNEFSKIPHVTGVISVAIRAVP
jgi:hypothetical protein